MKPLDPPRLDHRDLNHDMAIFASDPLIGSGMPLWLPAGAVIRAELERLAEDLARADGCLGVYTPVLGKRALFEQSGHWAKFQDDMFPTLLVGEDELVLRPANCPHHALVYAAGRHSYRELPIRLHELAPMFRAERSGVLSGLTRVRQISLDDTHVFCRPDQVAHEAVRALRSALRAQDILGLPVDYVRLSLRGEGPGRLGADEQWEEAEDALREAARAAGLGKNGLELVEAAGEAAFYGPKLDLQVRDGRCHEETIATVQLDFNQPERFDLRYDAADGSRPRVVMIHRGAVGAMERATASLLEHYQGRLPLWLAPVQVCVLPVAATHDGPARALHDELSAAGLRPIAVLGDAEVTSGVVQVTDPASGSRRAVPREDFVAGLRRAYANRAAALDWLGRPPGPGRKAGLDGSGGPAVSG